MWARLRTNHEEFGALSGYKVIYLSRTNYKDYVSDNTAQKIQ